EPFAQRRFVLAVRAEVCVPDAKLERIDPLGELRRRLDLGQHALGVVETAFGDELLGLGEQTLRFRRQQPLEEDPDLTFRLRPDELRDGTSLAERDDVRDRADIEHGGDVAVLVRVDLDELDPAGVIGRDLLDDRTERTARAAPRRPEVDDDGQPFRSLENLLLERRGRDVHRRSFAAIRQPGRTRAAALRPARLRVREYSAARRAPFGAAQSYSVYLRASPRTRSAGYF